MNLFFLSVIAHLPGQTLMSARKITAVVTPNGNARTRRVAEHVAIAQLDGKTMAPLAARVGVCWLTIV